MGRVCHAPGFGDIKETITHFDEAGRTFTYEAIGLPFFFRRAENQWTITPVGNQTRIQSQSTMQLLPVIGQLMSPFMRKQIQKSVDESCEELKHYIETGKAHPRKVAALAAVAS